MPCYIPQHGPGRKTRRIALESWQQAIVDCETEAFLRGLIHSDGCRCINRVYRKYHYPRYFFTQVSDDIRALFCAACDQLGIEYRLNRPTEVSIARRESVAKLDEFIGLEPHPHAVHTFSVATIRSDADTSPLR